MPRVIAISGLVLALIFSLVGCDASPKAQPELLEKVRQEAAKILKKDAAQLDVHKSLGAQGADQYDIAEIVMAIEEACEVEIPESEIGEKPEEVAKTLTVEKLADIVAGQIKKQKR